MKIRRLLGVLRRRGESLCFALLLLFLLPAAGVASLACLARGRGGPRLAGRLGLLFRRWGRFLCVGLQDLRDFWWVQFRLEPVTDVWRHIFLLEWCAIRSLGQDDSPGWTGALIENPRVLVVKFAHYGDAMHIVPMMRALKAQRPAARVDLLVGPWGEDLARRIPYADEVLVYAPHYVLFNREDKSSCMALPAEMRFLEMLRTRRYDAVISTSATNFPEWLIIHAADPAVWVGVPGPAVRYSTRSVALLEPYDTRQYEAERVAGLVRHLGLDPGSYPLEYPIRDDEKEWADRTLRESGVSGDRFVAVMAPGSGWPGKNWPIERFAELADWLVDQYSAVIVLVGSRAERALGISMRQRMKSSPVDLIGRTRWGEMAAVLQRGRILITNDSAPLHLASALGISSVSLFGPSIPGKWAPRGSQHRYLHHPVSCSECWSWHSRASCYRDNACMKAIGLDEVKDAVRSLVQMKERST